MNYLILILNIILCIYLFYCTICDIKTNTVSLKCSLLTILLLLFLRFLFGIFYIDDFIISILPGTFILFMGIITHQSIGYGDGIVFIVSGIALGKDYILLLVLGAFIFSSVYSLFLLAKRKSGKTTIPFVPFIFMSYFFIIILILI